MSTRRNFASRRVRSGATCMPPEAAPLAADTVIVAGFFVFWAEVGEIIRTINSRGRREPCLIIHLMLANRSRLCALSALRPTSLTAKGTKDFAKFAEEH